MDYKASNLSLGDLVQEFDVLAELISFQCQSQGEIRGDFGQ